MLSFIILLSSVSTGLFSVAETAAASEYTLAAMDKSDTRQQWAYTYIGWDAAYGFDIWAFKNVCTGQYLTMETNGSFHLTDLRKDAAGNIDATQVWGISYSNTNINLLNKAGGYTGANLNLNYDEATGAVTQDPADKSWNTYFYPVFTGSKAAAQQSVNDKYGFVWWQQDYTIGTAGTILLRYKNTNQCLRAEGEAAPVTVAGFSSAAPGSASEQWEYGYIGWDGSYDLWSLKSVRTGTYLTRNNDGSVILSALSMNGDKPADNQLWAVNKTGKNINILSKSGGFGNANLTCDSQTGALTTSGDWSTSFYPVFQGGTIANRQNTYHDSGFTWWANNNAIGTSGVITLYYQETAKTLQVDGSSFIIAETTDLTNLWQYDYAGWDSGNSMDCWTIRNSYTGKYLTRNTDGTVTLDFLRKMADGTVAATQSWGIPQDSGNSNINLLNKAGGYSTANLGYDSENGTLSTSNSWSSYFYPCFIGKNASAKQAAFFNYGFNRWQENFTIDNSGTFMLYCTNSGEVLKAADVSVKSEISFNKMNLEDIGQYFTYSYVGWDGTNDLYTLCHTASGKYLTLEPDGKVVLAESRGNATQYWAFGNGNSDRLICKAYGQNLIECNESGGYSALYIKDGLSTSWDSYFRFHFTGEDALVIQTKFDSLKTANGHNGWNRGDVVGDTGCIVIEYKESGYAMSGTGDSTLQYNRKDAANPYQTWQYTYAGNSNGDDQFYIRNNGTGLYLTLNLNNTVGFSEKQENDSQKWGFICDGSSGVYHAYLRAWRNGGAYYLNSASSEHGLTAGTSVFTKADADMTHWFQPVFLGENAAAAQSWYEQKGFLYHIGTAPYSDSAIGKSGTLLLQLESRDQFLSAGANTPDLTNPAEETTEVKGFPNASAASLSDNGLWDLQFVRNQAMSDGIGGSVNTEVYRIQNRQTGLFLTGQLSGMVIQRTMNGLPNQLWAFRQMDNNEYSICNAGTGSGLMVNYSTNQIRQDLITKWTFQARWYFVTGTADIVSHTDSSVNPHAVSVQDKGSYVMAERLSMDCLQAVQAKAAVTQHEFVQNFQMAEGDEAAFQTGSENGTVQASIVKTISDSTSNLLKIKTSNTGKSAYVQNIYTGEPSIENPRGIFFRLKTNALQGAAVGITVADANATCYGLTDATYVELGYRPDNIGFLPADNTNAAQQWEYTYVGWDGTYDTWTFRNVRTGMYLTRKTDGAICLSEALYDGTGKADPTQVWAVPVDNSSVQLLNRQNGIYYYLNAADRNGTVTLDPGDSSGGTWFYPAFIGDNASAALTWFQRKGFVWHSCGEPDYSPSAIGKSGFMVFDYKNLDIAMEGHPDTSTFSNVGSIPENGFDGYVFIPVSGSAFAGMSTLSILFSDKSGNGVWDNAVTYIDDIGFYGTGSGSLDQKAFEDFVQSKTLPDSAIAEPSTIDKAHLLSTSSFPEGTAAQYWNFTKIGDQWLISNKQNGGYLTANADGVMSIESYSGSNKQLWHLSAYENGFCLVNTGLNAGVGIGSEVERRPYADKNNSLNTSAVWFLAMDEIEANNYTGSVPACSNQPAEGEYFLIVDYKSKRALQADEIPADDPGGTTNPAAVIKVTSPETENASTIRCLLKVKLQAEATGLPSGMSEELVWSIVGDPNMKNGVITPADAAVTGVQSVLVQFGNTGRYTVRASLKDDPSVYGDYKMDVIADADDLTVTILSAEYLNQIDYTMDSWKILSDYIDTAKDVMADPASTQAMYTKLCGEIEKAMESLVSCYDETTGTSTFVLSGPVTISKDFLKLAHDNGRTLVFEIRDKDGKMQYSWTFDGNKLKNLTDDLNLTIALASPNKADIELITGTTGNTMVHCDYYGVLPGPATIRAFVGSKFSDGTRLNLYRLNPVVTIQETVAENVEVSGGYASFETLYGADYFFNASVIENVTPEEPAQESQPESSAVSKPEEIKPDAALTLEKIQKLISGTQGDLITIRLKTDETFTAEMQNALKAANKKVRFEMEDAKGTVYLVQQFMSFEKIKNDIPLGINTKSPNYDAIMKSSGKRFAQVISFRYGGELPGEVKIIIGKEKALKKSLPMKLYFYEQNSSLTELTTALSVSNDDLYFAFAITKSGEFVIVNTDNGPGTTPFCSFPLWAWILIISSSVVAVLALTGIIIGKKKSKNKKDSNRQKENNNPEEAET